MDDIYFKVPPRNIEAEESILSSIMLDKDSFNEISNIINSEDFYKNSHKIIFKSIEELKKNNEPIDIVTVANNLKKKDKLTEIGGASYLAQIVETIPMAANRIYYSKIIKEKSILRDLIKFSNNIVERCFKEDGDSESIIKSIDNKIRFISENKATSDIEETSSILNRCLDKIEQNKNSHDGILGLRTGIINLDYMLGGLNKGHLIYLAAKSSMGKTALAINVCDNISEMGASVLIFSYEMTSDSLIMRMLSKKAQINSNLFKKSKDIKKSDWSKLTSSASQISNQKIKIVTGNNSIEDVKNISRKISKSKDGLDFIMIDYIQLMPKPKAERNDLAVGEISRQLKFLSIELDIPVLALSQLSRKNDLRNDKRPIMSDLRDSGNLEQDADVILFIHREYVYNKEADEKASEIIVAKNRDGEIGSIEVDFIKETTQFIDRF